MRVRCGRLDRHEPHDWNTRPLGADWPRRTYSCGGEVVIEGGAYWAPWDIEDDAAEERAAEARREAS